MKEKEVIEENEEEEEEAEGRDMHQVPGIRDKVMSRHVGTSGPMSRKALVRSQDASLPGWACLFLTRSLHFHCC